MSPEDRRFFAGLFAVVACVSLLAYTFVTLKLGQPEARVVQPSVPSLIPPPFRCPTAPFKPFRVVCPYCRNTLSVEPSATGSTGDVVGATADKSSK